MSAPASPDITSTYYMSHGDHDMDGTVFADYEQWSGRNRADAIEKYLNDAFTAETGGSDTVAYNLVDGMGLGAYSYPRLMGLTTTATGRLSSRPVHWCTTRSIPTAATASVAPTNPPSKPPARWRATDTAWCTARCRSRI